MFVLKCCQFAFRFIYSSGVHCHGVNANRLNATTQLSLVLNDREHGQLFQMSTRVLRTCLSTQNYSILHTLASNANYTTFQHEASVCKGIIQSEVGSSLT